MAEVSKGFAPLQERIRKEGRVLPGNIIKIDGFLNHRGWTCSSCMSSPMSSSAGLTPLA